MAPRSVGESKKLELGAEQAAEGRGAYGVSLQCSKTGTIFPVGTLLKGSPVCGEVGSEEIGNDCRGPTDCLSTQQGQGPKASCVRSSPPWVRTQEKARKDRRPRTAVLGVGSPEVVGPEVALGPGPATRWRPKAGNGGQGERGAAGPKKRAFWTWGPGIQPSGLSPFLMAPQDPSPTPHDNPYQPIHQAQEGGPTPESHV